MLENINYRKPRWGLAHASDFWLENPVELYVGKTQTVMVVLKSTWCSFYLKVQQRRAHDVSQVRRRPIFYTRVGVGKDPVRLEFLKICPPAEINCWAFMQEILRPREGMMMTLDLREKLDL